MRATQHHLNRILQPFLLWKEPAIRSRGHGNILRIVLDLGGRAATVFLEQKEPLALPVRLRVVLRSCLLLRREVSSHFVRFKLHLLLLNALIVATSGAVLASLVHFLSTLKAIELCILEVLAMFLNNSTATILLRSPDQF